MKIKLLALLSLISSAFAQGPLLPSTSADPKTGPVPPLTTGGIPQPTMKSLHQVEPRTPLTSGSPGVVVVTGGNIVINLPGSYYLTQNLAVSSGDGITITADNVTVDLEGFTISSNVTPPSGSGVVHEGLVRGGLTVKNGNISGTGQVLNGTFAGGGFQNGIRMISPYQVTVSQICVKGVSQYAIQTDINTSTLIEASTAHDCGLGIHGSTIAYCTTNSIIGGAIVGRTISNSVGRSLSAHGITGDMISGCHGTTNASTPPFSGIYAVSGVVANSHATSGGGTSRSLTANIANSSYCSGISVITNKYNMP